MRITKHSYQKITITHTQTSSPNNITFLGGEKGVRPSEVGARAQVFEKLATVLRLKQKLLKCKSTIKVATFNVRSSNGIGQLPELKAFAIDHNIDIIWMQGRRNIQSEYIKYQDTGNEWTFVLASAWKKSVNVAIGSLGMHIGLQTLKSLNSIEKIQLRMMVATFNGTIYQPLRSGRI